jgi:hypothetical protein
MGVRRRLLVCSAVVGIVAAASVGSPTDAAPRELWSGSEVPADLEVRPLERGAPTAVGTAGWAGIDFPGPVGPDGCADVPTDPPNGLMVWPAPRDEQVVTEFLEAELCDLAGGGQELRLTGPALADDRVTVIGSVVGRVYRAGPAESMTRLDVEISAGRCFALGSTSGYPGDGTEVDDYVMQGWNWDADPTVDCSSRSLPVASTTTTSSLPATSTSTTTSAPTTSTTSASAGAAVPAPATAVTGTPDYAG